MSESVPFPINEVPFKNVDSTSLSQINDSLLNGFIDELQKTNKRPGFTLKLRLGTGSAVDGLYWWENRSIYIAVSAGRTFKIINAVGDFVELTGDLLEDGVQPTFTDNGDILVIANSKRMVTTNATTLTTYIADADAPTEVTHVAFIDQWLLANEVGTGRFRFADFINAPTVWFAFDVFTAESNPDNIIGLYVNKRIIHLFGTQSTEFWFSDGISPFSRLQGTTIQRGAMSPYCTVSVNEELYFFDNRRRLTKLIGQTPQILNTSFDKFIQNFDDITDTRAEYVTKDGKNWVLFHFPDENKTLMYDIQGNYWAEWNNYDLVNNSTGRFLGAAYSYARLFNQHVFGSWKSDEIFIMDSDSYSDDDDQIRFSKITGHIDYNTPDRRKTSYRLTMRLKTGTGIGLGGNSQPQARLRWRDDGNSVWGNFRNIPLQVLGDREFVIQTRNLGSYYTRQWELQMYEDVPFVIGDAVEVVDVGEF